jgi:hypothetical protein
MQNLDEKDGQDNIGYENTEVRTDQDTRENARTETTDTGHNEGPAEDNKDRAGLRSESGKKSTGKESGNLEQGETKKEDKNESRERLDK